MGKKYSNSVVAAAIQLVPVAMPVTFMGILVKVICYTSKVNLAAESKMEGLYAKVNALPTTNYSPS
jgi:hypothetical protein